MKVCTKCRIEQPLNNYHVARRYKDGRRQQCKTCRKSEGKTQRDQERKQKWYQENKDITIQRAKSHYKNNKELRINQIRTNEKLNITKYRKIKRVAAAKRRAYKLRATPKWTDLKMIKNIYDNCPEGHEVDHIIPLQGKNVSGLHVPNNLQYLTVSENRSKSNKWEV